MEIFSALLAICAENSPMNSPHKGQWRGALMFSLIRAQINGRVNNREAGDLRRHQAHCDVIVMGFKIIPLAMDPAGTQRNDNVSHYVQTTSSTSFWRNEDVVITLLLRHVSVGEFYAKIIPLSNEGQLKMSQYLPLIIGNVIKIFSGNVIWNWSTLASILLLLSLTKISSYVKMSKICWKMHPRIRKSAPKHTDPCLRKLSRKGDPCVLGPAVIWCQTTHKMQLWRP